MSTWGKNKHRKLLFTFLCLMIVCSLCLTCLCLMIVCSRHQIWLLLFIIYSVITLQLIFEHLSCLLCHNTNISQPTPANSNILTTKDCIWSPNACINWMSMFKIWTMIATSWIKFLSRLYYICYKTKSGNIFNLL